MQNTWSQSEPGANLPEPRSVIDVAYDVLLNPVARDIVAFLAARLDQPPGQFMGQIVDGTGLSRGAVYKHLKGLESVGIVVADISAELRHGRSTRYTVNPQRIRELMDLTTRELLGE